MLGKDQLSRFLDFKVAQVLRAEELSGYKCGGSGSVQYSRSHAKLISDKKPLIDKTSLFDAVHCFKLFCGSAWDLNRAH